MAHVSVSGFEVRSFRFAASNKDCRWPFIHMPIHMTLCIDSSNTIFVSRTMQT
jgi:hypothetical protein